MTYTNNPTKAILSKAWEQLKCRECGFYSRKSFLSKMNSEELHYNPIVIFDGEDIEAVIFFDKYAPSLRTCNVHFITSKDIKKPIALMREARRIIHNIARNGDICILFAFIPHGHNRAVDVARLIGFKQFAISQLHIALSL